MPELAEVEYYRKQWNQGLGKKILGLQLHAGNKIFRGNDLALMQRAICGAALASSETHGKQMLFRFSKGGWLGLHLGMTGSLRTEPAGTPALKHDHLVLQQKTLNLVFSDPRQFGRVLFYQGATAPAWWQDRPPQLLSKQFTAALVQTFLSNHGRAPIKAVLLMQSGFPGVGNWMADEVLWQARINPARLAGQLTAVEARRVRDKVVTVSQGALKTVGEDYGDLPKGWLFSQRWKRAGICPRDGATLNRADVGGRTTCWCPSCQKPSKRVN